jgi:hypothetical protein
MKLIMESWRKYISEDISDLSPEEKQTAWSAGMQKLAKDMEKSKSEASPMWDISKEAVEQDFINRLAEIPPERYANYRGPLDPCKIFAIIADSVYNHYKNTESTELKISQQNKNVAKFLIKKATPVLSDVTGQAVLEAIGDILKTSSAIPGASALAAVSRVTSYIKKHADANPDDAGYHKLEEETKKIVSQDVYLTIAAFTTRFLKKRALFLAIPFIGKANLAWNAYDLSACATRMAPALSRKYQIEDQLAKKISI